LSEGLGESIVDETPSATAEPGCEIAKAAIVTEPANNAATSVVETRMRLDVAFIPWLEVFMFVTLSLLH
jgi:hypothetical protein